MKKIILLIVIAIFLNSCNSGSALKFSDTIVKKEKSLEPEIVKTEDQVKNFIAAGQFDSMAVVSEKMESLVNVRLNEIRELKAPAVKYAEEFKKDAVDYFAYMKSVYTSYVKYARAETDEMRNQELLNLQEVVNKKNDVLQNMRQSQKKFADANGFKIEN